MVNKTHIKHINNNTMKHVIKLYFSTVILAGLMLFNACEEDVIDPLSGIYPVPTDCALNDLLSQNAVKGATTRTFTLDLGSSSQHLVVDFVSSRTSYFLIPGVYTIAAEATAKAGNYVAGQTRWVTPEASLPLTDGSIFVKLDGDTYTINGTVMLEDRSIIKIAFTGAIVFEPDPPAFTYTWEVQKPYAYTTDGMTFIPVAGSQLNKVSVSSDGIPVAYFEIVTEENRASLAGTYPVSGMITDVSGAVVQGLYMDLSEYVPGLIIEGGSHLLNDDDKQYISAGGLTIADNGGILAFTSSDLSVAVLGVPVDGVKSINYVDATLTGGSTAAYTYTLETSVPAMGGMMGADPIAGSQMNKISVFAGSDLVAYFELVSAENPASLAGDYVVTDGISATGQAANGFQFPVGWGGMSGGCYYLEGATKMFIRAGGGNISITDNAGILTITGSNLPILDVEVVESSGGTNWANLPTPGSINYQNVTPAGSGGSQLDLPNLLSAAATDLAAMGAGTGYIITLKLGEVGVTAMQGPYGVTIGGTGKYISIDFKRDVATLPVGTYNIVDNATAADGDAIAGYYLDLGFMAFPTGCFLVTLTADTEGAPDYLTSGTVTVAESGGVYTVTVNATTESGEAVQAVFAGAITIQ
jgi:hypothetical protein